MKNLPLIIHDDILRKKHLIVANLNSKFYKVLFDSIQKTFNNNMLSSLKTIGSNIREVEFIQCSVKEPKEYRNILNYFLKAEKLSFNSCSFRNLYKQSDDQVLELENLRELLIKQSCLTVS